MAILLAHACRYRLIGHAAARAVAQRVHVAEHTLRRHRAPPTTKDNLVFLATVPSRV